MKRDHPAYVVRLKGVLYFKRRGWPTRKFDHQEIGNAFYAEYATILNGTASVPKAFLVKGLIVSYYKSNKFQSLKPRTQADYRRFLTRFENNAGSVPVADIERKHVIAWRDHLVTSDGAHYANYWVRVVRVLLEYAIDIGEASANVAKGVGAVTYAKKKPMPWPKDKIKAVRKLLPHSHRTRLLFEMLYCTGQRVGDVLSMKWSDIRGGAIRVTQGKTGVDLVIPLTDDLKACLRAAERAGEYILAKDMTKTQTPGPWAYRGAAAAMMKLRKHKDVQAQEYPIHAIRHTVASEIGAAGSDDEIAAVTGHTTKAMVAHYAGAARQQARAKKAQKRRK